jgi:uncharacterized protein with HEPN domain
MMVKRVEHFIKKGYLAYDIRPLLEQYKTTVRYKMQSVRNAVIKYNMTKRVESLDYVREALPEIRSAETELLRQIFAVQ